MLINSQVGSTSSIGSFNNPKLERRRPSGGLGLDNSRSQQDNTSEHSTFSRSDRNFKLPRLTFHQSKEKGGSLLMPPLTKNKSSPPISQRENHSNHQPDESLVGTRQEEATHKTQEVGNLQLSGFQDNSLLKQDLFNSNEKQKAQHVNDESSFTVDSPAQPAQDISGSMDI